MEYLTKILASRHLKNSLWPVFETVLPPLFMLVAVPVFIRFLGAEKYGIWILVNSIAAFVGFLNVGFGDSNIKFISKYRALENELQVKNVVHAIYSLSVFALAGGVLFGIAIAVFMNRLSFFGIETQKLTAYTTIIPIAFALFSMRIVEQSFLAIFKGFERYDLASKLGVVSKSMPIIANIAIVYFTSSLVLIFLSSVFISMLFLVVDYLIINKCFVRFNFLPRINPEVLKEIMGFSLWSFLQGVMGILGSQIDKLLVARLAGLKTLAYYSVAQMVVGQMHAVFSAASSFIFPIVARKVELKESLEPIYYKMQFLVVLSGILAILTIFLFRDFIFLTWLGYDGYIHTIKFAEIFLILELFLLPTIVSYYYLNAGGFIHINTYLMGVSVASQIVLMMIFFKFGGIYGLALGKLTAIMIVSVISIYVVYIKILRDKNSTISVIKTFIPGVMFVAIYYLGLIDNIKVFGLVFVIVLLLNRKAFSFH